MSAPPTTYWDYIKVDRLLGLQSGLADDEKELSNDEVLFITVHQIDELWFKLVLRELAAVRDAFAGAHVEEQVLSTVVRILGRTDLLFRQVAQHFELMETLTTRDYLSFRDKLLPASGFQSHQLREIEILMGLDESLRVPIGNQKGYDDALREADGTPSASLRKVQARRAQAISVREAVTQWLHRTPIEGSRPGDPADEETVQGFVESYLAAAGRELEKQKQRAIELATDEAEGERLADRFARQAQSMREYLLATDVEGEVQAQARRVRASLVFIESYRELPLLAWPRQVIDALVSLEQAFVIFRQRHARMVERVIGRRTGTGGSAGVEYLDATALRYRVFPDLWATRTILIQRSALPQLSRRDFYDFARSP